MTKLFELSKDNTIILKGIAILFVLLGHMNYIYNGGSWGVSLFLILSGYGVFKSYKQKGNKKYFNKKIKKVYIPFIIVSFIISLYYTILGDFSIKRFVFSTIGLDFGLLYDKTMWYISFIFLMYFIFYITCKAVSIITREKISDLILILLNVIISAVFILLDLKYHIWGAGAGVYLYSFSFSLGLFLAYTNIFEIKIKIKRVIIFLVAMVLITVIIYLYQNLESGITYYIKYFIYANSMPILLVFIFNYTFNQKIFKIFNYLGTNSYYIYLFEGFILANKESWFSNIINIHVINTVAFIICILAGHLYKLILNKKN